MFRHSLEKNEGWDYMQSVRTSGSGVRTDYLIIMLFYIYYKYKAWRKIIVRPTGVPSSLSSCADALGADA